MRQRPVAFLPLQSREVIGAPETRAQKPRKTGLAINFVRLAVDRPEESECCTKAAAQAAGDSAPSRSGPKPQPRKAGSICGGGGAETSIGRFGVS
jgi:hypothetical protein